MTKNVVIVESPAKAKTIEKFLGKDFTVTSSFGHIRDLPRKQMAIDIENGFAPTYEISEEKQKTVSELKKLTKKTDIVWLATDEDREGEAIAWHLAVALNLDKKKTKRIAFHEITKPAVLKAIENPRTINQPLVDAQQARRVLDRLVGYELSPVLWKKVRTGLSAGRVQSVAVRLIVEREREIDQFNAQSSFKVTAEFDLGKGKVLQATLKDKFPTEKDAHAWLKKVIGAEFKVADLQTKPAKKSPAPPFTTSTLQQEASRKLGFSVKQTMVVAQKLYESGKITYMRTDSVNLSETAISQASKAITDHYGSEFLQTRRYKTKTTGAQEAHEAIRPTDFSNHTVKGDNGQTKLYELIWKRAIASQMADAALEKTVATISISTVPETLEAHGEVIKFEGFLKVYLEGKDDQDDEENGKILPPLKIGQELKLDYVMAREVFTRPPARYTEASLVKKMEEMGIGRPSTYAPTISTIQDRGYIEKTDKEGVERKYLTLILKKDKISTEENSEITGVERNKLFPTDTGSVVNDFLVKYFSDIVDYHFTAKVEAEFDEIAHGKKVWNTMIADFYTPFHKTVEKSETVTRAEASHARELGIDPKTQKPIFAKIGRYGAMLQLGSTESEEKPRFAPMPEGKKLDTVTLEEALPLFDLPRVLGKDSEGGEVIAQIGRFGPYVKAEGVFASINHDQLFSIKLKEALELIKDKKEQAAKKIIHDFTKEGIQVLNGRYGPYITDGKKNAKIPKDTAPEKLTVAECQKILEEAPSKAKRQFTKKKTKK